MSQTANTATQASVEFLRSIWHAVVRAKGSYLQFPDEDFADFIGIISINSNDGLAETSATTLCFIIDTTGSMGNEIKAVKDETIRLTEQVRDASDYVLSPFNDPGRHSLSSSLWSFGLVVTLLGVLTKLLYVEPG